MKRRQKLNVPFARRTVDEATKERLKHDLERQRRIVLETYDMYRKRNEFELERIRSQFKLSKQALEYLKRQGCLPGQRSAQRRDYTETEFQIWLQNYPSSARADDGPIKWENRFVTILAFLLPKETREEWLGDLQESIHQLISTGSPRWMRILITLGRVFLLVYALAWIRLRDLVSLDRRSLK